MRSTKIISGPQGVSEDAATTTDGNSPKMLPSDDLLIPAGAGAKPEGISIRVSADSSENRQPAKNSTGEVYSNSHTCDSCGVVYHISDWPFCPHGKSSMSAHVDDIPGGLWMENLGPNPIKIYSHTERERIMKERGLELKEKFCPMPGTDIDPAGVQNPKGYVDAQTLANGAELICRQQTKGQTADFDGVRDGVIRNLFEGRLTERDAVAVGEGDPRRSARLGRRIGH